MARARVERSRGARPTGRTGGRSSDRVQDAQRRRARIDLLAHAAARGEPCVVPPWSGDHDAATAGRGAAAEHGPDCVLSDDARVNLAKWPTRFHLRAAGVSVVSTRLPARM